VSISNRAACELLTLVTLAIGASAGVAVAQTDEKRDVDAHMAP
jgi:hypothetical protein